MKYLLLDSHLADSRVLDGHLANTLVGARRNLCLLYVCTNTSQIFLNLIFYPMKERAFSSLNNDDNVVSNAVNI